MIIFFLLFCINSVTLCANNRSPSSIAQKSALINKLINNGLYFSAQEIIRGELKRGKWAVNFERSLEVLISEIGTEQLDRIKFSNSQLRKSKNLSYISAKQDLRLGNFKKAVNKISSSLSPSANYYANQLFMLGSAQLLAGQKKKAVINFMDCENLLRSQLREDENLFGQEIQIIHDTCVLNQARLDFEEGNFEFANKQYEKIKKSSLVWPEILFEEAWSSFYLGNYNRTLGKLVTYKSPFFDFIFNPEVEVLEALSYMELCFYENTQKVVNDFYQHYANDAKYLKSFMRRYGSSSSKIGSLLINVNNREAIKNPLLRRIFHSINKDLIFKRLMQNYENIKGELALIKNYPNKRYISYLGKKLKASKIRQKKLIGMYGLRILDRASRQLDKSFRGMSYIRLEILKKEKDKFFGKEYQTGKVGNLKNVRRDSRHYLWEFNGEFWADELGDYVFSLKSECKV